MQKCKTQQQQTLLWSLRCPKKGTPGFQRGETHREQGWGWRGGSAGHRAVLPRIPHVLLPPPRPVCCKRNNNQTSKKVTGWSLLFFFFFFSFHFPPAAPKPDRPIARCGTNGPSALGTERGQSSRCHSPAGVPPRQRGLSRGANRGRIFPGRIFRGSISSRAGICSPLQAAPLPPFNPRGRDPRSVPAVPVRCPRSPLGVRDPRSVSATLSPCP